MSKIKPLKLPKKKKPLKLNPKKHINKLEQMMIPFEKEKQKRINIQTENYNIKRDSDYSTSSDSESSSSDDEFEFKPKINLGNRKITHEKEKEVKFNGVEIAYIPTNKDDIEQRYLHKVGIVPRGYSNFIIVNGSIGSGKTNALINMLMNPLIYGFDGSGRHWFDNVFVLTNSNDDAYDNLIKDGVLKPSHIKHQPTEEDLKQILDAQKQAIKLAGDDGGKIPNTAIIFDDIIDDKQFINSKYFKLCAIRPRQMHLCCFLLSQHFNSIPRIIRVNAQNLILFSGNKVEQDIYTEQYTPAGMAPKQFEAILKFAWAKRPNDQYPFIHINRKAPVEKGRFFRNFTEMITLPNN